MSFYYQNVRGVRTKTNELLLAVLFDNYDVIAFSETWLAPDIDSVELFDDRYLVVRHDRSPASSDKSRGGGVLLAVKTAFEASEIPVQPIFGVEHVWVKLKIQYTIVICGCIYVPPNTSSPTIVELMRAIDSIVSANSSATIFIVGDFNFPDVGWVRSDDGVHMVPHGLASSRSETCINGLTLLGLDQYNNIANHTGSILDLVWTTSDSIDLRQPAVHLLPIDNYHPPLTVEMAVASCTPTRDSTSDVTPPKRNFRRANYDAINAAIDDVDWTSALSDRAIDDAVTTFYNILTDIIASNVPFRKQKPTKFPHWFSRRTLSLLKRKNNYYRRYSAMKTRENYNTFSATRREFKAAVTGDYRSYVDNTQSAVRDNIRAFWGFVKSKTNSNAIPKSMFLDDIEATGRSETCELFARFFESNYIRSTPINPNQLAASASSSFNGIASIDITEDQVRQKLEALDANKNAGPDSLPPLFLKSCAATIARPLALLFNASLRSGIFPRAWKDAFVMPLFKSGNRASVRNYRGISILSAIPKILEIFITEALFDTFRNQISTQQHGFFKGRSTTTNLLDFTDTIYRAFEDGFEVHAVYTDFQKAFDRVDHAVLLSKLVAFGVGDPLLAWIRSYLSDRSQIVRIEEAYSAPIPVLSGVPQGSHLSPILFNLFVNDVGNVFRHCNYLLYADDVKLYTIVKTTEDCTHLQEDLDRFQTWCADNKLALNTEKCKQLCFSRKTNPTQHAYTLNGTILGNVDSFRDLGVLLTRDLSFVPHVDEAAHRAWRMLGFIKRITRDFDNIASLRTLFCSLVRSVLEYASTIWSPHQSSLVDALENIQHNFSRYALFRTGGDPTEPRAHRLHALGLANLSSRRDALDLRLFHKLLNGTLEVPRLLSSVSMRVPSRDTRSRNLFAERIHRTNYASNAPLNRLPRLYNTAADNNSSLDIFSMPLSSFRRAVDEAFGVSRRSTRGNHLT